MSSSRNVTDNEMEQEDDQKSVCLGTAGTAFGASGDRREFESDALKKPEPRFPPELCRVPAQRRGPLWGSHATVIGCYLVEGRVTAGTINRLLAEKPDIVDHFPVCLRLRRG